MKFGLYLGNTDLAKVGQYLGNTALPDLAKVGRYQGNTDLPHARSDIMPVK